MIVESKPLSIVEAMKLIESVECEEEKKKTIKSFFKKNIKMKYEDALKMKEEVEKLDFFKVKGKHISKIIDFLPEDASELNKIFTEESLNEDETNKLLEIVKKYK